MSHPIRKNSESVPEFTDSSLSALFKYIPQRDANGLPSDEKPPLSPEIPFQVNLQSLQNLCLDTGAIRQIDKSSPEHFLDDTETASNLLGPLGRIPKCVTQKINFGKINNEKYIANIKMLKTDRLTIATKDESLDSPSFVLRGFNNLKQNSLTPSLPSVNDEPQVRYRYSYIGKKFSQLRARPQDGFDSEIKTPSESRSNFAEKKLVPSCSCKSSRCLKLYCECFKSKGFCGESCRCTDCLNQKNTPDAREAAISKYVQKRVKGSAEDLSSALLEKGVEGLFLATNKTREDQASCRCKVSACTNRYCGCYSENQKCKSSCTCVNCLNSAEKRGSADKR